MGRHYICNFTVAKTGHSEVISEMSALGELFLLSSSADQLYFLLQVEYIASITPNYWRSYERTQRFR